MKVIQCSQIQEQIAWAKTLNEEAQRHVLSCLFCVRLAEEFAVLDSKLGPELEIEIPSDFAERVMAKIESAGAPRAVLAPSRGIEYWSVWLGQLFEWLLRIPEVQVGFASLGTIIAFANIVQFVLSAVISISA